MADFARIYARQEYMTPGAAETVAIIAETVRPDESTQLLEVAAGKGEASATLASQFGCKIVAVEPYDAFVHIATAKFWAADGGNRIAHAALHIHGGISIDLDYAIHRYFLWLKAYEFALGSATPSLLRIGKALADEPVAL